MNINTNSAPTELQRNNGFAVTGLVLGIVGLLIAFIPFLGLLAAPLLVVGLVFAALGLARTRKGYGGKAMSITGITLAVVGFFIMIAATGSVASEIDKATKTAAPTLPATATVTTSAPATTKATSAPGTTKATVATSAPAITKATVEMENALGAAENYLKFSHFSKKGLSEQLKYEKYSPEAIEYAVNTVRVDWNEQAVGAGQDYLTYSDFSKVSLMAQLEFDGFTKSQVQHAVATLF